MQTSCQKSVEYINRRYPNEEYTDAVLRIKKINPDIHIVTHIIFGLPGETEEDMLNSVKFAVNAKTDGIKIQVLNVLKGTRLEDEYLKTKFHIMQSDEYFELVKKALKIIPPETVIHRLTGDGAKRLLIEPKWVSDKKFVLNNFLNKILYSI